MFRKVWLMSCLFASAFASDSNEIAYEYKSGLAACPKEECIAVVEQQPTYPCPDRWRISGDFLYFLPTVDDTYFVLKEEVGTSYPALSRKNNDFGYSPGFRFGAAYALCDTHREFSASFSHLTNNQAKTVSGTDLWATVGLPDLSTFFFKHFSGIARSSLHLLYQHFDLNFSQQILDSYGIHFYVQPGIEYAYLRLSEEITYLFIPISPLVASDIGIIDKKSRLWGIGPKIGLDLDYNFIQGRLTCSTTHTFSILAQFSGSLLTGRGKTQNFQTLNDSTRLDVKDEHTIRTIPALHARAGLNYNIRGKDVGGSIEIGYEFNSYLRALSRTIFTDDVVTSLCLTNYYNIDIQGLYVSGMLTF